MIGVFPFSTVVREKGLDVGYRSIRSLGIEAALQKCSQQISHETALIAPLRNVLDGSVQGAPRRTDEFAERFVVRNHALFGIEYGKRLRHMGCGCFDPPLRQLRRRPRFDGAGNFGARAAISPKCTVDAEM